MPGAIDCPKCGTINSPGTETCDCGYRFKKETDDVVRATRERHKWLWGAISLLGIARLAIALGQYAPNSVWRDPAVADILNVSLAAAIIVLVIILRKTKSV
jgi:hypothetical protein